MVRSVGRVVVLSAVGVAVLWGVTSAPQPVWAVLSWLVFGYLLRAAWPQIVRDAGRLRRVRVVIPRRGGRYRSGGSL